MPEYIDKSKIPWRKEEFEERCHNDRWTETKTIAYKSEVDKIPPEEVRKDIHAEWVGQVMEAIYAVKRCSHCGEYAPVDRFCSRCGAFMGVEY